ncbi:MAG TPA: type II toxin-antitoxin system VapC family toxin [Terriglobales bacterium]|nr:type II toxin-antitoxin system VapC family toxin [Terriglobales bacterium]
MQILIDTSVLIDVLRLRYGRRELLAQLARNGHVLAVCPINITELFAGMRSHQEARTEALLGGFHCFEITGATGRLAGTLKNSWARKGIALALSDSTIAAVAIERSCVLMTDNVKHFPMDNLQLYSLPPKQ